MDSIIGITFCSTSYWMVMIIYFVISVQLMLTGVYLVIKETKVKKDIDYKFDPHDIQWTVKRAIQ